MQWQNKDLWSRKMTILFENFVKAENECNEADKINSTYDFQKHC